MRTIARLFLFCSILVGLAGCPQNGGGNEKASDKGGGEPVAKRTRDGGGGAATPKGVLEALNAAAKAKDYGAMFDLYSKKAQEKLTDRSAFKQLDPNMKHPVLKEKTVKEVLEMAPRDYFIALMKANESTVGPPKPYEIGEETIEGDKATVKVKQDGKEQTLTFVKEGGAWKLDI